MPKSRRFKSRKSSKRIKHRRATKKYRKHRRHRSRVNNGVKRVYMKGGYGPGAGPVGSSWGPNPDSWPNGMGGNESKGNHYSHYPYGIGVGGSDTPVSTRGDLANLYPQNGGSFFPISQDIINMGRSAMYGATKFVSDLGGSANLPVNPDVTHQKIGADSNILTYEPPNVREYANQSISYVSSIV